MKPIHARVKRVRSLSKSRQKHRGYIESSNGRILATTETYCNRADAKSALRLIRDAAKANKFILHAEEGWVKAILVLLIPLLTGCVTHIGKDGLTAATVTPPTNAVVNVSYRKIGVNFSYNPANQMPTITVGFESGTYNRVPLDGQAPNVFVRTKMNQGNLTTDIDDSFATGDGASEAQAVEKRRLQNQAQ